MFRSENGTEVSSFVPARLTLIANRNAPDLAGAGRKFERARQEDAGLAILDWRATGETA
jgi:hypothetical protein